MRQLLSRVRGRRRTLALAAVAAVLLSVGGAAGIAVAATTGHAGTTITRVSVVTQDTAAVYTAATWTNVGATSIYATAGQFVVTRFTAESACYGAASGWCSVRVLVDGLEAEPVVGTDFAFNDAGSSSSWESLSVERVKTVAGSGTHTVIVQTAVVGAGLAHRLDDWALTATAVAP